MNDQESLPLEAMKEELNLEPEQKVMCDQIGLAYDEANKKIDMGISVAGKVFKISFRIEEAVHLMKGFEQMLKMDQSLNENDSCENCNCENNQETSCEKEEVTKETIAE